MLKKTWNFILRICLCSFTFHKQGEAIQSSKAVYIYSCDRCGNLFALRKPKYKNKTRE